MFVKKSRLEEREGRKSYLTVYYYRKIIIQKMELNRLKLGR